MTNSTRNSRQLVAQAVNEVSRSNKSNDSSTNGIYSPLKRAIKENENSIIQTILSPSSPTIPDGADGNGGSKSNNGKITVVPGLSPLLDYLFEDGQLTRVEYDIVDKSYRTKSSQEQVQSLLRILVEEKDDEALQVMLEYLMKLDPNSDTIRKLCATFVDSDTTVDICSIEVKLFLNRGKLVSSNSLAFLHNESKTRQDFYYGRNQRRKCEGTLERKCQTKNENMANILIDKSITKQELNKPTPGKEALADYRDFYLTNGCLEVVRWILLSSKECQSASGWETVLRYMNGLLSTDVLSIKDLLYQQKCANNQIEQKIESQIAEEVRRIEKEYWSVFKQMSKFLENIPTHDNKHPDKDNNGEDNPSKLSQVEYGDESTVNWDKIFYHSLQVWKQRNGWNSTFFSLIGIFQHSQLYRTADLLLEMKMGIQARESEKDVESKDIYGNIRRASTTTMLEKSDFLRKFYTPPSLSGTGSYNSNSNIKSNSSNLTTTKERVSASPVLSLDLL